MRYSAAYLIGLIVPGSIWPTEPDNDSRSIVFPCRLNWSVSVSYDCGDFDYLNHFVDPEGREVDFWDWPEGRERKRLVEWGPWAYGGFEETRREPWTYTL